MLKCYKTKVAKPSRVSAPTKMKDYFCTHIPIRERERNRTGREREREREREIKK